MRIKATGTLHTTAFRVAAVYAVLYALLTGTIVLVVFTLAERQIYIKVRDGLVVESTAIASLIKHHGPAILHEIVQIRSAQESPKSGEGAKIQDRRYYLLTDADGHILGGDLAGGWPQGAPSSGWYRFNAPKSGTPDATLALITILPGGMHLLVGQSLATPSALGAAIKFWAVAGAGLALLAGLAGGAAIGTRVMRQIREAGSTAERIRAGSLNERLKEGGASEQSVLAQSFNSMLDKIETAVLGLRDLAARTAHEMKHPLTRTDQALARAQNQEDVKALHAEIATARGEIADLARRIDALLRLARMEAGDKPEFFKDIDLAKLAADVVELYSPFAEDSGHALRLEATKNIQFSGDRQLLAQALANLVDNAIKFSPPNRGIIIRVGADAESYRLEVEDGGNGPNGMKPSHAGADSRGPGAGLGLAIIRAIARLHGGELELIRQDRGFTARLRLPCR